MLTRTQSSLRLALAVVGAAALMAASGAGATNGAPLVVGQTNSATLQTALQGSMASPVFLITNFSTASGAYGLSVNGNSSSTPAIGGGNGGSGIGFRGLSVGGIGALGIHTSTSGSAPGVEGDSNSTAAQAVGVLGRITTTSGAGSAAVKGINSGTGSVGVGVYGTHAGSGIGVYGDSPSGTGVVGLTTSVGTGVLGTSPSGTGVRGEHTSSAGASAGVVGDTYSTADNAVGILGRIISSGPGNGSAAVRGINNGNFQFGYGVWGSHEGLGYGVYGSNPSGGSGVFGQSTNGHGVDGYSSSGIGVFGFSSTGPAGSFDGDVDIGGDLDVTGTLTKGGGAFKIDHPLDPARKYLQHSFVESPDMLDVYNGNVVTDAKGFATVRLPRYFQALNRSFRYQLTIVGTRGWNARVVREIAHNRFTIQTDQPKVKVSWQVTGIRHDAYANAHRIKVVVPKTGADNGKYLHPELYGQPKSKGIDAETLRLHRERVLPAR
jgi:hypothetical protein